MNKIRAFGFLITALKELDMSPTFFIKKKIKAKNLFEAAVNESHAKLMDVWTEEEYDEEEEPSEVHGFEYVETKHKLMNKKKPTPKMPMPKKAMPMKPKKKMPMKGC